MCLPIWSNCKASSAAIPPSARHRASRVTRRRNSCSARPPWRPEAMTKSLKTRTLISRQQPAVVASVIAAGDSIYPGRDCPLCPRLVDYRMELRARDAAGFNSPVPSFGDSDAALLIVGLAPGAQGANRTGRPFTGDYAGDLLYATLLEYGF